MRLAELWVDQFKNLRDLRVRFDQESPYTVLVGENGSGKSNLIEAITWIFRSLDLEEPAPFGYEISYSCRGHDIKVTGVQGAPPEVWLSAEGSSYSSLPR